LKINKIAITSKFGSKESEKAANGVVKKLQEKGILSQPKNQKDSIWNFEKTIEQS